MRILQYDVCFQNIKVSNTGVSTEKYHSKKLLNIYIVGEREKLVAKPRERDEQLRTQKARFFRN
jgi:hypothetical protein